MDIQRSVIFLTDAKPSFNPIFFLMLACIIMSAFFSMSETAFSSASSVKIKSLVEDRKRGAKKALYLAENFDKTIELFEKFVKDYCEEIKVATAPYDN